LGPGRGQCATLHKAMGVSAKGLQYVRLGHGHPEEVADFHFELRDGERWFVVQTLHHREKLARLHLTAQCFRSFLPSFRKTVRHARQWREVVAPVFPGYIFVALDPERDRWRSINGTFSVARLVCAHGRPTPVPAGVVEALLATVDETGLVRFDGGLRPGQPVRVLAGPFAQIHGVLERLDGKGRVRVLLKIMGCQAPITIDQVDLTAA
jgi:transcription antitermination factor NusG